MKREQLEQILMTDIPETEGKELWIWGAGNTAGLYQEGLARINLGSEIAGYCDSKRSGTFCGRPIVSPQMLKERDNICVLICSAQPQVNDEIMAELRSMGIAGYLIDEIILKKYADDVMKCYDLLCDERSKDIYAELVISHIKGKNPDRRICSDNTYFVCQQLAGRNTGGVFVDCGAYVGDTIEKYIWQTEGVVDQIIGIEPDEKNYEALVHRKQRLCAEWNIEDEKIRIVHAGVGAKTESRKLIRANGGLGSRFADDDSEGTEQKVIALDDLLTEPYSFLKADVESFEYKMLMGAQTGITKWKPDLAVCIYHNAVDLFSIAQLIHSFVPEYKIAVRHHMYGLAETVLYAWME